MLLAGGIFVGKLIIAGVIYYVGTR